MSLRACLDIRAGLSAYIDGDLDPVATGETRAHLESCAACRAELDLLRLTVDALRGLPELQPPAGILAGVRARLRPDPWYKRLLDRREWLIGLPVGALATLVVIIGISLFQARYPGIEKVAERGRPPTASAPAEPDTSSGWQVSPPSPPRELPPEQKAAGAPAVPPGAPGVKKDAARKSSAVAVGKSGVRDKIAPAARSAPDDSTLLEAEFSPEPPGGRVAALESAVKEESQRRGDFAAVPPRISTAEPKPALEEVSAGSERPGGRAPSDTYRLRDESDASAVPARTTDTVAALQRVPLAKGKTPPEAREKKKLRTLGADLDEGRAVQPTRVGRKLAAEANEILAPAASAPAPASGLAPAPASPFRIVCMLTEDADTVDWLVRLLRNEGATEVEITELESQAVREAFASRRGRFGTLPEPDRGWTLTALVPAPALARLPDALGRRPGWRILEQPGAPLAQQKDSSVLQKISITVLR